MKLRVAATDLNVSLTAELKSHNASDGGIAILAKSLLSGDNGQGKTNLLEAIFVIAKSR